MQHNELEVTETTQQQNPETSPQTEVTDSGTLPKPFATDTDVHIDQEPHSSIGLIIGSIVVILILALGGLYYWGAQLNTQVGLYDPNLQHVGDPTDPLTQQLQTQSSSDSLEAIESDVLDTDLTSLDTDFADIQAELESALEVDDHPHEEDVGEHTH